MTVALLCIGTELTRGDVTNTNGSWLAQELTERGFEVAAIDVVDDDLGRIIDALRRLSALHEWVICTGGLGPTTDDITRDAAAALLGVELNLDPSSLQAIETRMLRFGRVMSPSNRRQAYFPAGATVLPNDYGTAPGFVMQFGRAKLAYLPGVPQEMRGMFADQVAPLLELPEARTPFEQLFHTYGMGESALNDALEGIEAEFDVTIGYRVRFPEVDVKVLAREISEEASKAKAERASRVVRERLGEHIYAEGRQSMPEVLGERLMNRNGKLAIAESCTGGLVSSLITEQAGASAWFLGGVVCYANEVKTGLLGVKSSDLESHGAVSREVAEALAHGIRRLTSADYGLSITGIAGPTGGTADKPVGTVWFGLVTKEHCVVENRQFHGERTRIQRLAAYHGLKMLLSALPRT